MLFIILSIIVGILLLILQYLFLPVFAYWFLWLAILIILIWCLFLIIEWKVRIFWFSIIWFALFYIIVIWTISTTSMFRASSYHNLIWNVEQSDKIKDKIKPIVDPSKVRIVDENMAMKLAEKKIWEFQTLWSQVYIWNFSIQSVNGNLFWVAPLEHSWFWKWLNTDWTPWYVKVSATNQSDVSIITKHKDWSDINLKYLDSAFFWDYINRHIYYWWHKTVWLTDYTFEIDDEWNPYWVITNYSKKIWFSWDDAIWITVVNPENWEIKDYWINDAPKWVDRIQPEDIILEQLNNWWEYVHGWWNPSNKDKYKVSTDTLRLIYAEDGKSYWYAGITTYGSDQSIAWFVLVNTRTKETIFFKQAWATESAVMRSAEWQVQQMWYNATSPILYNISWVPTYIMSLKDNEWIIKNIAFVSVEDYTLVWIWYDLNSAFMNYKTVLANAQNRSNWLSVQTGVNTKNVTWTVKRIGNMIQWNSTYYYIMLDNSSDVFYGDTASTSQFLPVTKEWDKIEISYEEDKSTFIQIRKFTNKTLQNN